jgi:hypothetical protein
MVTLDAKLPMVERVVREIGEVAAFYGVAIEKVANALELLRPHLANYAELTLAADGFEVLTGGFGFASAVELGAIAERQGAPAAVVDAFAACVRAFPGRMAGLKMAFGGDAAGPSLYVRAMAKRDDVLHFLARLPGIGFTTAGALEAALAENATVYAIAFQSAQGGALAAKVYALADGAAGAGFVTYCVRGFEAAVERTRQLAQRAWERIDLNGQRWLALLRLARERVGYARVSYVGAIEVEGAPPDLKLFVAAT